MKIPQIKVFQEINSINLIEHRMNEFVEQNKEDIIKINAVTTNTITRGATTTIVYTGSIVYLKELED